MSWLIDNPLAWALMPALQAAGAFVVATTIWPRPTAISRALFVAISLVLLGRYLYWRLTETLPEPGLTADYVYAVIFMAVEFSGAMATALAAIFLMRTRDRSADADANADWLANEANYPRVDVLICSYNEEESIVERTIVGAQAMTYPNFRVWMLDDSRRPWLKDLCATLNCGYIARPTNEHAKAGNINNALRILAELPERPQFVSVLDADFVPTPRFLSRAMALFRDEAIGVVQTPQHFMNPDPIQSNLAVSQTWPDEQRYFFDVVLPAKDAWKAAICCGTSSVTRFEPLLSIGGIPTDSVTEDYLLTLRMKEIGLYTAYLNERLTFGLAPEGLKEYATQRARWCLGFMQIARGRSGPFSFNNTSFLDRVALLETFLNWSASYATRVAGLAMPVLLLVFNVHPIRLPPGAPLGVAAHNFLPFFVWHSFAMHWIAGGKFMPILSEVSQLVILPQILRAVVAGLVKPQGAKFQVTAKGGDRRRGYVEWGMMRPFLAAIALSVGAIVYAFDFDARPDAVRDAGPALFWIWYNMAILVITCFVCVEQPRRRSERYPSDEWIKVKSPRGEWRVQLSDLSLVGAGVRGPPPAAVGTPVEVEFSDCRIEAKIIRATETMFALNFDTSLVTRVAMIRHFHAGDYVKPVAHIEAMKIGVGLLRRVLS